MYIYCGLMTYDPFVINNWFFLVIESDFKVGAPARAFWQWTRDEDGNENVNQVVEGSINKEEDANYPNLTRQYGVLYDSSYPLNLAVSNGKKTISATMYRQTYSGWYEITKFDLSLNCSARDTAPNYNPTQALPTIRYYEPRYWKVNLFAMIAPGNLCQGEPIWYTAQDQHSIYTSWDTMNVLKQDDSQVTITFHLDVYNVTMELGKNDDGWKYIDGDLTSSVAGLECVAPIPLNRGSIPSKLALYHSPMGQSLGVSMAGFPGRTTTKVVNDTDDAMLCTLEESGTSAKSKVLAGAGMGLAALGILPLGGFATPVAVIGMLLATVGLYDSVNEADSEVQTFLFPNDDMSRRTSGGIPIGDNNDLAVIHVRIANNVLSLRVAVKEKVGDGTVYLKSLLREEGLFKSLIEITWAQLDDKIVQACKFLKLSNLVPLYGGSKALPNLSNETLYDMSDGQMIVNKNGSQVLWDTLIADPSRNDTIFQFSDAKVDTLLLHAHVPSSPRSYVVGNVPGSKVWVLKLTKCFIDIHDNYRNSLATPRSTEADVHQKILRNGGLAAYSWHVRSQPFSYRLKDLVEQKGVIKFTQDSQDMVYIPISGWLPWQRMVSK